MVPMAMAIRRPMAQQHQKASSIWRHAEPVALEAPAMPAHRWKPAEMASAMMSEAS